jgi:hypothetical protein
MRARLALRIRVLTSPFECWCGEQFHLRYLQPFGVSCTCIGYGWSSTRNTRSRSVHIMIFIEDPIYDAKWARAFSPGVMT